MLTWLFINIVDFALDAIMILFSQIYSHFWHQLQELIQTHPLFMLSFTANCIMLIFLFFHSYLFIYCVVEYVHHFVVFQVRLSFQKIPNAYQLFLQLPNELANGVTWQRNRVSLNLQRTKPVLLSISAAGAAFLSKSTYNLLQIYWVLLLKKLALSSR